ncbi:Rid family detoxifying hydrolase [Pseudonocardia eucalypti]|uniref:Rid family detoxifying hydrolase n=1 Tax=Pseudonocardia eucalypti TaxID=648755 RepID=A0ABP9Q4T8_9PSEU|nr:reactive intermediate/imine deaminase [Pseudonocardia eucalypti]
MPALEHLDVPGAARPKASYSQAVRVGDLLYTAGFGPHDPATGQVRGDTVEEQTEATLENLRAVLGAADLTFADVVRVGVHLRNLERDFAGFERVYRAHFAEPYPARTTVGSALPGILVEIELVAGGA